MDPWLVVIFPSYVTAQGPRFIMMAHIWIQRQVVKIALHVFEDPLLGQELGTEHQVGGLKITTVRYTQQRQPVARQKTGKRRRGPNSLQVIRRLYALFSLFQFMQ
jgi:hypothetical protein